MGNLEQELQKIYDSEINLSIYWMWDTGFDLKLGDEFGGFVEGGQVRSVADVLPSFQEAIAKRTPTRGTYFRNRRFTGLSRRWTVRLRGSELRNLGVRFYAGAKYNRAY